MNINFFKPFKFFSILSIAFMVLSLFLIFFKGFNYGTDFTGGIEFTIDFKANQSVDNLQKLFKENSSLSVDIEETNSGFFIIRSKLLNSNIKETENILRKNLNSIFGKNNFTITQSSAVGGVLSKENKSNSILISLIVIVLIIAYLSMRFKVYYGIAAIIAVIHDLLLMLGIILILNIEVNVLTIIAVLTIFGYSVNDTIILFDRIRERQENFKSNSYLLLLNQSINSIFSRTIITSLTTLIVVLSLYLNTSGNYQDFAFNLIIGLLSGTYSSIYIACGVMLVWNNKKPQLINNY